MADTDASRRHLLQSMAEPFARGDAPGGERLLSSALEQGLPWDQVTQVAACGVEERYRSQRHETSAP